MYYGGWSELHTLLASAAQTASGTQEIAAIDAPQAAVFLLDLTAAATDGTDTLNVYIQRSIDGGTTWRDVVSFAQFDGTASAAKHEALWTLQGVTPDNEIGAVNDGALAAGNVDQGCMLAPDLRVKWVIAGAPGPSFSFSVKAKFQIGAS